MPGVSARSVSPYPWNELPPVPRDLIRRTRRIAHAIGLGPTVQALARSLGALVTSDVEIVVRSVSPRAPASAGEPAVTLESRDGAVAISLAPEPALATALLARLLSREVPITDPKASLPASLRGALAALAIETVRRAEGSMLALVAKDAAPIGRDGLEVIAKVHLDGRPYDASLSVTPLRDRASVPAPAALPLWDLPVTLAVVLARSVAKRQDVIALRVSDIWLPGGGAFSRDSDATSSSLAREVALTAPRGEHGVLASVSDSGRIVVRGGVVTLAADEPAGVAGERQNMGDTDDTLREIALEADVVVRVEVGSVTLTAREWAELGPGDVIETGVRLTEPVVLRVAGREVARGELVNVDGELGVKISEILGRR
jgi:flagellar motor switch/type III secretory pathway protein FliN